MKLLEALKWVGHLDSILASRPKRSRHCGCGLGLRLAGCDGSNVSLEEYLLLFSHILLELMILHIPRLGERPDREKWAVVYSFASADGD